MWDSNYSPTIEHVLQVWFFPFEKVKEDKVMESVPAVTMLAGSFDHIVLFLNNLILDQEMQLFSEKCNEKEEVWILCEQLKPKPLTCFYYKNINNIYNLLNNIRR